MTEGFQKMMLTMNNSLFVFLSDLMGLIEMIVNDCSKGDPLEMAHALLKDHPFSSIISTW